MFTGIIQQLGKIVSVQKKSSSTRDGFRFVLQISKRKVSPGESVAIEGVCLTVIKERRKRSHSFLTLDAAEETVKKTTLGKIFPNQRVNVEWPLEIGQELGGHFVQGHVDATGKIIQIQEAGNSKLYWFSYPAFLQNCLVPKGSIAVDGISLTLVDVREEHFSVAILPFTEEHTSLRFKKIGDEVNLESDILAKTIARQFQLMKKEIFPAEELYQKINLDWDARMAEEGYK